MVIISGEWFPADSGKVIWPQNSFALITIHDQRASSTYIQHSEKFRTLCLPDISGRTSLVCLVIGIFYLWHMYYCGL